MEMVSGSRVEVYGKTDCPDTQLVRDLLDRMSVTYRWRDVESEPGSWDVARRLNGGRDNVPTVHVDGGEVLVEPTADEVLAALRRADVIDDSSADGGPSGR